MFDDRRPGVNFRRARPIGADARQRTVAALLHKARIGRLGQRQADRIIGSQTGQLEDERARRIGAGLTRHARAGGHVEDGGTGLAFGRSLAHRRRGRLRRHWRRRRDRGGRRLIRTGWLNRGVRIGPPPQARVRGKAEGDEAKRECANPAYDHQGDGRRLSWWARGRSGKSQRIMQIVGGHGCESIRLRPDNRESIATGA